MKSSKPSIHPNSLANLQKGRQERVENLSKKKQIDLQSQLRAQFETGKKIGYREGYIKGYKAGVTADKTVLTKRIQNVMNELNEQKKKLNHTINRLQIKIASLGAQIVNWDTTNYLLKQSANRIETIRDEYKLQHDNRFDIYNLYIYIHQTKIYISSLIYM